MKAVDQDRTPVAQDIFTYCTREKIDTWHIVRNHDAKGVVDRVICKACKSDHKYKKVAVAKVVRKTASKSTVVRKPTLAESSVAELKTLWLSGIKRWGEKVVTEYSPEKAFERGDVLSHSVFGKGVVQTRRESRVDVLFSEGVKTLPSKRAVQEA